MNARKVITFLAAVLVPSLLHADPCGMVPPIYTGPGQPITRIGQQQTYVFYKDGIETFVIRPGFSGKVDEFGMLIPFPNPPALRKVPDHIFPHLAAAVDPPEVVVDLRQQFLGRNQNASGLRRLTVLNTVSKKLKEDEVRVVREEAVGMYDPRRKVLEEAASQHAEMGYRYVFSGHYEGEHWLATFAVYLHTCVGLAR